MRWHQCMPGVLHTLHAWKNCLNLRFLRASGGSLRARSTCPLHRGQGNGQSFCLTSCAYCSLISAYKAFLGFVCFTLSARPEIEPSRRAGLFLQVRSSKLEVRSEAKLKGAFFGFATSYFVPRPSSLQPPRPPHTRGSRGIHIHEHEKRRYSSTSFCPVKAVV